MRAAGPQHRTQKGQMILRFRLPPSPLTEHYLYWFVGHSYD